MSDAETIVGEDVLRALIDLGNIVQVQSDIIFLREAYDELAGGVLEIIDREGRVDVKTLRDHFNTSRKYAIGLLEHLDSIGVTRRDGDYRVRGRI
jgi:selenocysteine-specific elongation factor